MPESMPIRDVLLRDHLGILAALLLSMRPTSERRLRQRFSLRVIARAPRNPTSPLRWAKKTGLRSSHGVAPRLPRQLSTRLTSAAVRPPQHPSPASWR
jgi:hypothetical protein